MGRKIFSCSGSFILNNYIRYILFIDSNNSLTATHVRTFFFELFEKKVVGSGIPEFFGNFNEIYEEIN